MKTWIANIVYGLAAMAYLPVLGYQMAFQGKNRRGWGERFGRIGLMPTSRPRVWVHAVSLGEVNATTRLVEKLAERFPDHEIVISSTTDTGYARACSLFGEQRVFRYPLDFSWVIRRVLDRVGADLIVLMELEVWHNLVRIAAGRGVRVAVANGRLTERSAKWLARLGPMARSMMSELAWVGTQDSTIAARFKSLGVSPDRVEVTGSMKWDTVTLSDAVDGAEALAAAIGLCDAPPLWVCGSTGPGEEEIILDAYRSLADAGESVILAIVPRKPERFGQVARIIRQRSFECIRRMDRPDGTPPPKRVKAGDVILGDTMGELRKFYALATVVFVGRSMVAMGGSDPMEAAAIGKPIVVGPHTKNFALPIASLAERNAACVVTSALELADAVRKYCCDAEASCRAGTAARDVVRQNQGATDATIEALGRLMEPDN